MSKADYFKSRILKKVEPCLETVIQTIPHKTGSEYLFCDGHVDFTNWLKTQLFLDTYCYPK